MNNKIDLSVDYQREMNTIQETAEQKARDILERIGIKEAQSFSSGDLVELANLIAELERLRHEIEMWEGVER